MHELDSSEVIPGNIVCPRTESDASIIGQGFFGETTTSRRFEVIVVVFDAISRTVRERRDSGLIVRPIDGDSRALWPYMWDFSRWNVIRHCK